MDKEIKRLEDLKIISPCAIAEWGTPMVPILKSDGSLRLCGDYKVTVNKFIKDVKYPMPRIEEVLSQLNGGKLFSKIDLSQAYHQFELDDESRRVCAISTHKGVYFMNRLPFGIRTGSAILQQELEKFLAGKPGVVCFQDDVLVTGANDKEHLERLAMVFEVLQKAGFKLNQNKCKFFQKSVVYLGFKITENGISKTDEHIKSIESALPPKMFLRFGLFVAWLITIVSLLKICLV